MEEESAPSGSPGLPQDLRYTAAAIVDDATTRKSSFQCSLCSKTFGYKNGLIRHVRLTHVGEKPYQCNICQRRFGYKHILMEHQNLHFGNRPYACTLCDKRFAARSNLIQHRLVHKKPLSCHMCNKRFDRDEQLRKHLFAHPQSMLTCNFCGFAAVSQTDLNKHMMDKHPPQVLDTRDRRRSSVDGGGAPGGGPGTGFPEEGARNADNVMTSHRPASLPAETAASPNLPTPQVGNVGSLPTSPPNMQANSCRLGNGRDALQQAPTVNQQQNATSMGRGHSRIDTMFGHLLRAVAAQSAMSADTNLPHQTQQNRGEVVIKKEEHTIKKEIETEGYGDETDTTEDMDRDPTPPPAPPTSFPPAHPGHESRVHTSSASAVANLLVESSSQAPMNLSTHLPSFSTITNSLGIHASPLQQQLNTVPHTTLPAISEMFRSRRLHTHPPALPLHNNFNITSDGLSKDFRHPLTSQSHAPPTPVTSNTVTFSSPNLTQSHLGVNTLPVSAGVAAHVPAMTSNRNSKPTAQLPPISHVLQSTKDNSTQHSSPIPGFPDLEDVLAYYISQGKLFRCQHCNILFYERGMYFLHASLHGNASPWECSICHKICSDKNEFTLHFVNQQHT